MMLRASRRKRRGFTLLELLLAAFLAVLLLGALYLLMDVTVKQTQTTRENVEVDDLSRGVFNRLRIDLSGALPPLPPKSGGNNAASSGGVASQGGGTTTSTTTTGMTGMSTSVSPGGAVSSTTSSSTTTTSTTTSGSSGSSPSATDDATVSSANYAFQAGVIGDADQKMLIIFSARVPEAYGRYGDPNAQQQEYRPDQREIIYWLGPNGGLYRRERPWVTATGVSDLSDTLNDPNAPDSVLLAEEVVDFGLEFTDGTADTWVTTWDGTQAGPDGVTPLGPPRAIRVTLTLKIPVGQGDPITKQVVQVIALRAAPGTYTPPLLSASTDGATDGSTDPSSSSSSSASSSTSGGGATGSSAASNSNSSSKSTPSTSNNNTSNTNSNNNTNSKSNTTTNNNTSSSKSTPSTSNNNTSNTNSNSNNTNSKSNTTTNNASNTGGGK